MKTVMGSFLLLLGIMSAEVVLAADLNTMMMEATCKISGPGALGTGFVVARPITNSLLGHYVLITADHVLRAVQGEAATIVLRESVSSNSWKRAEMALRIRNGTNELWRRHPDADVAAMFIGVPRGTVKTPITTELLLDDEALTKYEFHPGMELFCLGYPFGAEANALGFPILRSGRIASYPLTRCAGMKTFLFDFTVFGGNSGGPVYCVQHDPRYAGKFHLGRTIRGIVGIVIQESHIRHGGNESREPTTSLRLGTVVHASFIKELVESMAPPK